MMSQVDIDVRGQGCGKRTLIKLFVVALLALGVVITAAGLQHKREKAKVSVSWHNVSDSLHQVERAKVDLFDALRAKSP